MGCNPGFSDLTLNQYTADIHEKSRTMAQTVIDAYELSTMQAGMLGHSLREPASGIEVPPFFPEPI